MFVVFTKCDYTLQPTLAAYPWAGANLLQIGNFKISSHYHSDYIGRTQPPPRVMHCTPATLAKQNRSTFRSRRRLRSGRMRAWRSFVDLRFPGTERENATDAGSCRGCAVASRHSWRFRFSVDISVLVLIPWHCHLTYKLYSSSIHVWTSNNFIRGRWNRGSGNRGTRMQGCLLVPRFLLPRFPFLHWCRDFHFHDFHLFIFDALAFSTPAFSVAPFIIQATLKILMMTMMIMMMMMMISLVNLTTPCKAK